MIKEIELKGKDIEEDSITPSAGTEVEAAQKRGTVSSNYVNLSDGGKTRTVVKPTYATLRLPKEIESDEDSEYSVHPK